ncbi:MAG TPA: fibronectin type III domain-containing protein, partial [Vicinamibacterales bacterium]|nr:fibronectin type III domain-containing protein [Vicinamibacterales bacterium]
RSAAEGWLTWGGAAMGMGPDGQSLYFGCHDWGNRIARVTIAAIGGTGKIAEPCAPVANLPAINPGDPNSKKLGGSLWWNGRLSVSAYSYYDGNGTANASHFLGTNVANQAGPYRVGPLNPGLVGGYMGVIPQEWRGLLGGPALTGQCCIAVIARSSFGPSASVFNPDDLGTVNPVPSTMLVGYPEAHQTFGPWNVPNPYFTGVTKIGGLAFPSGTRTLLFIGRHGSTFCYGTGTTNQALDGTPDGQGNKYCYDPTDQSKGSHGYPYRHQIWAYDATDLLAVKQGTKQPWDVRPYAVWTLPEMNNTGMSTMRAATYDPATRRLYALEDRGDAQPLVHVYEITNAVIPPPEEVCGDGIDNDGDGLIDEDCAPAPIEVCGDGIDNDGDGLIDEDCVEVCGDQIDNDKDGQIDEGCEEPGALPGAPTRVSGAVKRSKISLKWATPITGGTVEDYLIEAGVAPGQTLYTTPVGNLTSVSVPGVGTGRYYVRVRARNQNGLSAPSNEVVLSVGCRRQPGNPTALTATTNEGLVSLAWTDPDGCSGTSYTVSIGTRENTADVQLLSSDDPSVTTLLASGTYFARVATHSEIGTSQSSVLRFTVQGNQCVTPRFRTKLKSSVSGRRVGLSWSPNDPDLAFDDDKVAPVSYLIEAGSAPDSANYGSAPMGRERAFLTDAPPGVYYVRVRPVNACGAGAASNEVRLLVK